MEQTLTLLAETPERIAILTDGLSPAQLQTRPAPDEWSAVEVLAHLRACADVWGGYVATFPIHHNHTKGTHKWVKPQQT